MITVDAGVTTTITFPGNATTGMTATVAGCPGAITATGDGTTITVELPGDVTASWRPQRTEIRVTAGGALVGYAPLLVTDETQRAAAVAALEERDRLRRELVGMAETMGRVLGTPCSAPGVESLHAIAATPSSDIDASPGRYVIGLAESCIGLAQAAIQIARLAVDGEPDTISAAVTAALTPPTP